MRCLSIPLAADFQPGSTVLDVGTGGGLPGLVSAICAPDVRFTLVDTQRKKIMAVAKMATLLGVKNILPFHQQVEHIAQQYDFDGTGCDTLAHISADGHEELAGRHCR